MHTCVLFVDDEPLVLSLYEALSPDLGPDFSVRTAQNGNEALRVLDQTKVQIVVSDLEMPEMPGSELLTHVEKRFPDAMRVVISGYDDELHVARCLTFGHRYLKKPISAENLASTLKRLSALRNSLAEHKVKALLSSSDALPSPPETYVQLSEALQANAGGNEDFAAIIEADPSLSVNLLEVVNSPAFGLSVRIESVQELFEVVGVHGIRGIILGLHTKRFYQSRTRQAAVVERLWEHGLQTASFSRKLASLERHHFRDCQTCYVAGLLHDIGKFVVAAQLDASNTDQTCTTLEELDSFERETLGVDHTVLGAYLLGLWGLPEPVVAAAELHHTLAQAPKSTYVPVLYVHAAQNLASPEREPKLDLAFLRQAGKAERLPVWREALRQTS